MNISKQVCSLENAKKLSELGVKREGYFYWQLLNAQWCVMPVVSNYSITRIPAYTVAELGQMLPEGASSWKPPHGTWCCKTARLNGVVVTTGGDNEAEARANLLVHLLENKRIDVAEVNG